MHLAEMSTSRPLAVKKMAVLWSHLSGYLNACLRECQSRNLELLVSWFEAESRAPFDDQQFAWLHDGKHAFEWKGSSAIDGARLALALEAFAPEMVLISGWHHTGYRRVAKRLARKSTRILCMDNPWEERAKQWLGRAISPWYVRPLFDGALVAGERQYQFARRLGFADGEILQGLYAPDHARFSDDPQTPFAERRGFIFVGRLVPEKGIRTLIEAYRLYRRISSAPWHLTVAGTGPLHELLRTEKGVEHAGFVQPGALPAMLLRHACMVVPSIREPWGVQISEGASAGLPLIVTAACGAAVHLLREGYNGHVVEANDTGALAQCMLRIERNPRLEEFSRASRALAAQFTPSIWADNLLTWPQRSRTPVSVSATNCEQSTCDT